MALDLRKRIQGFGSEDQVACSWKAGQCCKGHRLLPWTTEKKSFCHSCSVEVPVGKRVMDCRHCNYTLCNSCRPLEHVEVDSSFWGKALSTLRHYALTAAARDAAEIAAGFEAFVFARDPDGYLLPKQEKGDSLLEVQQEASQLLTDICQRRNRELVEPDEVELEAVWSRCCVLYGCCLQSGPVAEALLQQLAVELETEDETRRCQLRALVVLLHMRKQGNVGREIACHVARQGALLLQGLATVCHEAVQEKARKALAVLGLIDWDSDWEDSEEDIESLSTGSSSDEDEEGAKLDEPAFDNWNYEMGRLGGC